MPSYLVTEKSRCEVTFVYRVSADSKDEAVERYIEGEDALDVEAEGTMPEMIGVSVGDFVASVDEVQAVADVPFSLPVCFYHEGGMHQPVRRKILCSALKGGAIERDFDTDLEFQGFIAGLKAVLDGVKVSVEQG